MVIGVLGSDAGYYVLGPHGLVHVPGNNPEAREAYSALTKKAIRNCRKSLKKSDQASRLAGSTRRAANN